VDSVCADEDVDFPRMSVREAQTRSIPWLDFDTLVAEGDAVCRDKGFDHSKEVGTVGRVSGLAIESLTGSGQILR
jgi:hypothetical protein